MEGPCDICGDLGFAEVIVTCSKCGIAREHLYCMKVYIKEVPTGWFCETCYPRKNMVSPKSGGQEEFLNFRDVVHDDVRHSGPHHKACIDSRQQVYSRKLKSAETGKVKFLPTEEVIRLASGSGKLGYRQRSNFRLSFDLSHTTGARSRRTHTQSKSVTREFSCLTDKANPSGLSLRFIESPRDGDAQAPINTMMNHQAPEVSKESKGATLAPLTSMSVNNGLWMPITSNEVATSNTKVEKVMTGASGETGHDVEDNRFSVEERELLDILPKSELYCKYLPALEATWNGGFELSDAAAPGKFYGGFQAQPPCRVHHRALEFGKKLPQILQVNLLPRCHHWEDLFGNDVPDLLDIALYFFPTDITQRSNQNKLCLFELLEMHNLLMRCSIDGSELLIFTCKQLHVDCQRIIARTNTDYFLWGVFRPIKADQILHTGHEQLPSLVSPTECASVEQENMNNTEAIDMDIDMEGGRIVGTFDVVVSKQLSERICGNQWKHNVDSATEQILLEHNQGSNYSDSLAKFTGKIKREIAFEHPLESTRGKLTNAQDRIGHPPGFEEKLRLSSRIIEETLVDEGFINHINADIGLKPPSGGDFGASISLPQRFSEDSCPIKSRKHHQECASDLAYDPFAAYSSPLSDKYRSGIKFKDYKGGEMEAVLFPNEHNDSFNGEEHKNRYHPPYLVEVKDEKKIDKSVCWSPPPKGWVKLNIKGNSTGGSGVLRDESGKWILGYTENLGNCKSVAAELSALYQGLKLVWERGFRSVLVESVCHEAVNCLNRSPTFLDPNRAYIECCRVMLKRDWDCKVKHAHREGNSCANWLATHVEDQPLGKLAVFESPPSKLVTLLQNDCTGVAQPHPY